MKINTSLAVITLLTFTQNLTAMNTHKKQPLTHNSIVQMCDAEIDTNKQALADLNKPETILQITRMRLEDKNQQTIKERQAIINDRIQVLIKNKAILENIKLKKQNEIQQENPTQQKGCHCCVS
jgi:hypothetical protein